MTDPRQQFLAAEAEANRLSHALTVLQTEMQTYRDQNETVAGAVEQLSVSSNGLVTFVEDLRLLLDQVQEWRPRIHDQLARQDSQLSALRKQVRLVTYLLLVSVIVIALLIAFA